MSEEPEKKSERKDLGDLIAEKGSQITFENMEQLCNKSSYEIAGHTYKRKILKPRELVKLFQLQKEIEKTQDQEKRYNNLYKQAELCLEGITPELWEDTDGVLMEQVLSACMLINRGFRKV